MSTRSKPRIVFLDAGSLNFGDLSFRDIEKLGRFKAYYQTKPAQIVPRCRNADFVITNKCDFDRKTLQQLKQVRCIFVSATGVNNVDLKAARELEIAVANVSGYSTETVVQQTFAFILALASNLIPFHLGCRDGGWSRSPFFVWSAFPVSEISGKTLGILGYGTIGKRVAEVAKAFGMKVLVGRIPGRKYTSSESRSRQTLTRLLAKSDFLTLHCPLTEKTRSLIHAGNIRKMKPGSFLINMARGGIVHEAALLKALKSKWIAGAACDVLSQEPPPKRHPLIKAPNLLLTPHIAWASRESRERLTREIVLNIKAFISGRKRNRIL